LRYRPLKLRKTFGNSFPEAISSTRKVGAKC
jgi:hypothetical protein